MNQISSRNLLLAGVFLAGINATQAALKPAAAGDLVISEIMYNPAEPSDAEKKDGFADKDDFEFLELLNAGQEPIELQGVKLAKGVDFAFTASRQLDPGQRALLVKSRSAFQKRYGNAEAIAGNYDGSLKNSGEKLEIEDAKGKEIASVDFKDNAPWPQSADGTGFSIILKVGEKAADMEDPANWLASAAIGGTPGKGDEAAAGISESVVINEVIAHTDPPHVDSVEIYNPTDKEVDLSGWFLSDDRKEPKKYPIMAGTKVAAKGYVVLQEDTDDDPANNANLPEQYFGRKFSLSSHGDEIYLFSANAKGELSGYSHGFDFLANQNGVSFGRHLNSAGKEKFVPQATLTLGAENSAPREEPVVISEVLYHATNGDEAPEFVEIWNRSSVSVPLFDPKNPANTWQVDGIKFTFPKGVILEANEVAVISHIEPARFRSLFHLPESAKVFGPFETALANKGEKLTLVRPDEPDPEENLVPLLMVDSVKYNDKAPWPEDADGRGASLERRPEAKFSDDPAAWFASLKDGGTPGLAPKGPGGSSRAPAASETAPKKEKKPKKETSQVLPETKPGLQIMRAQMAATPTKALSPVEQEALDKKRQRGITAIMLWGSLFALFLVIMFVLLQRLKNR